MSPGQGKPLIDSNKAAEITHLRYLRENEVNYMLGMYLEPDGNNENQVISMHKKATVWETSIILGDVQQNKAWKSLNSTIPQTTECPLPAMTLN